MSNKFQIENTKNNSIKTSEEKVFKDKADIPKDLYDEPEDYKGTGFLTTQDKCFMLLQAQGKLRKKRK